MQKQILCAQNVRCYSIYLLYNTRRCIGININNIFGMNCCFLVFQYSILEEFNQTYSFKMLPYQHRHWFNLI